jgi:hypothetical protein
MLNCLIVYSIQVKFQVKFQVHGYQEILY